MVPSKLNPRLAYFIGALHSDGTFYIFKDKKKKRDVYRLRFQVGEKSLPMLRYLQNVFDIELGRRLKIVLDEVNEYGTEIYSLGTCVNKLLPTLTSLGIQKNTLPRILASDKRLFCAYLAGLIDGDGDIRIKRPSYPQCVIRITAGRESQELSNLISKHLSCSVGVEKVSCNTKIEGRSVTGTGYQHYFYLSSKNMLVFTRYVYPYIQIKHKRKQLQRFYKIQKRRTIRSFS